MKLAISNLAWNKEEDASIAKILARNNINTIDVVPAKYFPNLSQVTDKDIENVRRWWADQGIQISGMQSLLFETANLNIFGNSQAATLEHLKSACAIGAGLGATKLVFGSPRNRDRSGLSDEYVNAEALSFFKKLGDVAQQYNVIFCLEPTPPRYGGNFMTTSHETAETVRKVDHLAIKMQFDSGVVTINGESPADLLSEYADLIGHVHASEPDLARLGAGITDHFAMRSALERYLPDYIVSIEMLASADTSNCRAVELALDHAEKNYQGRGIDIA